MVRTLSLLLLISAPGSSMAQSALVPVWSHTWPYGQDLQPLPVGFPTSVSQDNHLAFDASTGQVHVTIDDQMQQVSPHFDYLFTFDANGTDLTVSPVPMLGSVSTGPDEIGQNTESTRDLVARNGRILHQRELFIGFFPISTAGSICAQSASGPLWRMGLGNESVYRGIMLVDDAGVVAVRPTGGQIMAFIDPEGWPQRLVPDGGQGTIRDAVLAGSEILGLTDGQLLRFDRTTGASLGSPVELFSGGSGQLISTDGQRVYFAYSLWGGGSAWACADLSGNVLWQHSLPVQLTFTELEVDGYGRPWLIGNPENAGDPPMLIVTGSDGGAFETFTYGATMNDLAMGDGQAYITGQLTNGDNTTYLIAVSTEISTGETMAEAPTTGLTLFPTPANSTLMLAGERIVASRVFDATGQQVQAPLLGNGMLDVSRLVTGMYFLEAQTASGLITKRFTVAR